MLFFRTLRQMRKHVLESQICGDNYMLEEQPSIDHFLVPASIHLIISPSENRVFRF